MRDPSDSAAARRLRAGGSADLAPLAAVVERFHRAESARGRDSGGAGLGLSIVRAIARAHAGEARAANRDGGGAVVTIELPAPDPQSAASAPGRPPESRAEASRPG